MPITRALSCRRKIFKSDRQILARGGRWHWVIVEDGRRVALKDGTPENYREAAIRHYENARTLRDAGHLDNAGHLVGFAAECAIKHKIGALGTGGASPQLHLPEILPAARKRLGERSGYASMFDLLKGDVFSDWAVDHRYSPTGKVTEQQIGAWLSLTQRLLAAAGIRMRRL